MSLDSGATDGNRTRSILIGSQALFLVELLPHIDDVIHHRPFPWYSSPVRMHSSSPPTASAV